MAGSCRYQPDMVSGPHRRWFRDHDPRSMTMVLRRPGQWYLSREPGASEMCPLSRGGVVEWLHATGVIWLVGAVMVVPGHDGIYGREGPWLVRRKKRIGP